ncbi:MAG: hypothetical protein KIS29_08615, partial [Thermoplasmata archaeon]|nr:hypothetical protein [Candidatus Sysuiplasma jiujiangense]
LPWSASHCLQTTECTLTSKNSASAVISLCGTTAQLHWWPRAIEDRIITGDNLLLEIDKNKRTNSELDLPENSRRRTYLFWAH